MSSVHKLLLRHGQAKTFVCSFLRNASSSASENRDSFIPIYKSSIIEACAAVNQVKKVSLFATATLIPLSAVGYSIGIAEPELPLLLGSFGLITTGVSICLGQLVSRLVGYIYVSEDLKRIKLSYIGFWGKRINKVHSKEEIGEIIYPSSLFDRFYNILEMSSTKPYLISFKYGTVLNPGLFKEIFNYSCNEKDYN